MIARKEPTSRYSEHLRCRGHLYTNRRESRALSKICRRAFRRYRTTEPSLRSVTSARISVPSVFQRSRFHLCLDLAEAWR